MPSDKSDDETTIDNEDEQLDDVDNEVVNNQKEQGLSQDQKIDGTYDIIKDIKINNEDEIHSLRTSLKIRTGIMILFIVLFSVLILVLAVIGALIGVAIVKLKENLSESAKSTVSEIGSFIFGALSDSLYGNDNLYGHSKFNKTFAVNGANYIDKMQQAAASKK